MIWVPLLVAALVVFAYRAADAGSSRLRLGLVALLGLTIALVSIELARPPAI